MLIRLIRSQFAIRLIRSQFAIRLKLNTTVCFLFLQEKRFIFKAHDVKTCFKKHLQLLFARKKGLHMFYINLSHAKRFTHVLHKSLMLGRNFTLQQNGCYFWHTIKLM